MADDISLGVVVNASSVTKEERDRALSALKEIFGVGGYTIADDPDRLHS